MYRERTDVQVMLGWPFELNEGHNFIVNLANLNPLFRHTVLELVRCRWLSSQITRREAQLGEAMQRR
jgi:hypothetical protein